MEGSNGKIKINFTNPSIYLVIDEWCWPPFDHHVANPHLSEGFWSKASIGCSLQMQFANMKTLLDNMIFMLVFMTKVTIKTNQSFVMQIDGIVFH
jgi:hypothetical protein